MFRPLTISLVFTCFAFILLAQETPQLVLLTGHILSPDSTAIEDAYLISYKTLRAFATNKEGHFEILLQNDDSLKIHHVSYKPVILKPGFISTNLIIIMEYEENLIEDVLVRDGERELKNLEWNMGTAMKQLNNEFLSAHTKGPIINPYAPHKPSSGMVGINIFELIDWMKHKRKK